MRVMKFVYRIKVVSMIGELMLIVTCYAAWARNFIQHSVWHYLSMLRLKSIRIIKSDPCYPIYCLQSYIRILNQISKLYLKWLKSRNDFNTYHISVDTKLAKQIRSVPQRMKLLMTQNAWHVYQGTEYVIVPNSGIYPKLAMVPYI